MGRTPGPKTYVMRLNEAERDLVLAYRQNSVTPAVIPVPQEPVRVREPVRLPDRVLAHSLQRSLAADPYHCRECGGMLGPVREGKRVCPLCKHVQKI